MPVCCGCGDDISDRYLLKVAPNLDWHIACLKCSICSKTLQDNKTCFIRNDKAYCKMDYERLFVSRCNGCEEILDKNALVMKAKNNKYHVNCFRCVTCKKRLSSGDVFALTSDGLLCEEDHTHSDSSTNGDDEEDLKETIKENCPRKDLKTSTTSSTPGKNNSEAKTNGSFYIKTKKDKPTRVRTVLNEKQLSTLKACYSANPRPDASMKEQLVELTGLSPRVIRVWFQNKRCKDKKKSLMMKGVDANDHAQSYSLHSSPLSDELSTNGFASLSSSLSLLAHASQQTISMTQPLHFSVPSSTEQPLGPTYRGSVHLRDYSEWRPLSDYSYSITNQVTTPGAYQQLAHFPSDPGIRMETELARI